VRTLLIGGARSGKSALAQRWATERSANTGSPNELPSGICAVVTGTESDPEMAARIAAHRRDRPKHWRVREEPIHLGRALREEGATGDTHTRTDNDTRTAPAMPPHMVLLDCLTLWISNCLWPSVPSGPGDVQWSRERADFLDVLHTYTGNVIIVTNEVGTGIVPPNAAARAFRDEQGWLNQAVAAACDEVFFVTAGLPLRLKPAP
jgi:adenosylcobinamide kinase/adenosylcobinamide-phosphate guanylyltransferase